MTWVFLDRNANLYSRLSQGFVKIPFSSLFPDSPGLLVQDTTQSPSLPLPLRFGDVNLDGFPDLLAISVSGRKHIPNLIYSVPCAAGVAGCTEDGSGRRGWEIATKGVEALQNVQDARSLSFLDIDEDVSGA